VTHIDPNTILLLLKASAVRMILMVLYSGKDDIILCILSKQKRSLLGSYLKLRFSLLEHHPLALDPVKATQAYSQVVLLLTRNGFPVITYWGLGNPRGICIATSSDDMLEVWAKSPK